MMRAHSRSKHKPDGMIKTVEIERELEREEHMIKTVGKYIKKTKRKLHQYELTLQNQPDLERATKSEFVEFDKKLYGNLAADKPEELPSIRKVKQDYKLAHPHPIYLSTGELILSKETKDAIEKDRLSRVVSTRCIDALNEIRKTKRFGKSRMFGVEPEGEIIGQRKIVRGFDTIYRQLRRKRPVQDLNSLLGKETANCGPLDLVEKAKIPLFQKRDVYYQLAFKSPSRDKPESSEVKKERLLERRGHSNSERKLSPLRERIHTRAMDRTNLTPFTPTSGQSSIGHPSPISTIPSPGKTNIFPQGFPKDPLVTRIEDESFEEDSKDGENSINEADFQEINFMFDLSCHNGKYYFDDTAEFLKAITKEKKNAGRVKRVDYAMGALASRTKANFLARASEAGSSFSYGSDDDFSFSLLDEGSNTAEEEAIHESGSQSLSIETSAKQEEIENGPKLEFASPTATAWTEKMNNVMFKSSKENRSSSKVVGIKIQKAKKNIEEEEEIPAKHYLPHDLGELKPALRKWYADNDIYSPARPQTANYLKTDNGAKYMQIAPELLLPDDYDGERAYGEEADAMYDEFKEQQRLVEEEAKENERKEWEDLKKQGKMDGGDTEGDIATYIDENGFEKELLSARSDEMRKDDEEGLYALSEAEELKLRGIDVDAHLEELMSGLLTGSRNGKRNTVSSQHRDNVVGKGSRVTFR